MPKVPLFDAPMENKEEQKIFADSSNGGDIIVGKGIGNAVKYFAYRGMLGSYYEVVDGK